MAGTRVSLPLANTEVAARLEELAELLEIQGASPDRVRSYRLGAKAMDECDRPVSELLRLEGSEALRRLPGIGESLACTIGRLVETGHCALLDRLRGESGAEEVLASVPGIGPELARRIHEELGIETLVELLSAVYDGRLDHVPGMGPRRLEAVRESLEAGMRAPERRAPPATEQASVAELLAVDAEYRRAVDAGALVVISPRRFNPNGGARLPVLHTEHDGRHYTALRSNTARAHELGATDDWVVVHRDDHAGCGQWTVATARSGALAGLRVVRGREDECAALYRHDPRTSARWA